MLFSHPELARNMSEHFECAWQSVRPVPRVSIDFGDGAKLERTLHGNIVTYFCTEDGEVYDLVPGLVDPLEYNGRLYQALMLRRARGYLREGNARAETPLVTEGWRDITKTWHEAWVARGTEEPAQQDPLMLFDGSKRVLELPIEQAFASPLPEADVASLQRDTLHNRQFRYPLASEVWLEHPFALPGAITKEVYERVLGVDLEDRYLGLAPEAVGGEVGRN